jgi:hypothetical protein
VLRVLPVHLGRVETFAPSRTVKIDSLEYTADSRGELVFLIWVLD